MARIVKKPAERRQEIIAAARELFQTQDYETTTMRDVMDKLGIAKGTIYHYFRSKEDLLEAVIATMLAENNAHMQDLLAATEGDALAKIRVLITAGNQADDHDALLTDLHRPGNVGMHSRLLARAIEQQAILYANVFQQGVEEGVFTTDHPLECAEFLLAGIQFLTDVGIYPWPQEDLLRRAMAFPALVEAQLQAPAGSFNFLIEEL